MPVFFDPIGVTPLTHAVAIGAPREVRGPERARPLRLPVPERDGDAPGAIELGKLKADKGNQNDEGPPGIDPRSATTVVIWCRQFSVLFAWARLAG